MIERFFYIRKRNSTVRRELLGVFVARLIFLAA